MNKNLPTVSIIIPIFNEAGNLKRLLPSLKKLTYPKEKLEILVIDDSSTDSSVELLKEFDINLLRVKTKDIERNKGIGMHKAKGEFIYWLDADMEICSPDFFQKLMKPLIEDKQIIGSFTKEFALDCGGKVKSSLLRFISYDPLQRDPLYQFFSPSIKSTIIKNMTDYFVCKYKPGKIPPSGRVLYRKEMLFSTDVINNESFIDLETLEIVARAGFTHFAYVPEAKIRHYHAETLPLLIKKRLRNLQRDYLPNINTKYYTWFDLTNPVDIIKIAGWILYVNLIIPELLRGIIKTIRYKDYAFLWHPIVSVTTTDLILFGFLSKPSGRKLITSMLKNLVRKFSR